ASRKERGAPGASERVGKSEARVARPSESERARRAWRVRASRKERGARGASERVGKSEARVARPSESERARRAWRLDESERARRAWRLDESDRPSPIRVRARRIERLVLELALL